MKYLLGLLRSKLIYEHFPGRARRMRAFYAAIVTKGDLCFDVGAHLGNRTRVLAELGCKVVAVEPHPYLARYLREKVARSSNVFVEEAAVASLAGVATLYYQPRNLTISSLKLDWPEKLTGHNSPSSGFSEGVTVAAVTLTDLIAKHGTPKSLKLDIEGADVDVLQTLPQPLAVISFEHVPHLAKQTAEAIEILEKLARYRFNYFPRETHRFRLRSAVGGDELLEFLRKPSERKWSGDVFAFVGAASAAISSNSRG
jgi:FkbM family methyltransferase